MQAIAVGAFHEHEVGGFEAVRVLQDGRVVLAEIAREHQLASTICLSAHPQLDARRTEDVPGLAHAHGDARQQLARRVIGIGHDLPQHRLDVLEVEQRLDRSSAALAIGALGFAHGRCAESRSRMGTRSAQAGLV